MHARLEREREAVPYADGITGDRGAGADPARRRGDSAGAGAAARPISRRGTARLRRCYRRARAARSWRAPMRAPRSSATARRRPSSTSIASSTAPCGRWRRSGRARWMPMSSRSRSTAIRCSGARRGWRATCSGAATARSAGRSCWPARTAPRRARCRAASPDTFAIALARIAELMDRQEDVLVLYTTSHGTPFGLYYNDGDNGYGAISPNRMAAMLDRLGHPQSPADPQRLLFGRVRAARCNRTAASSSPPRRPTARPSAASPRMTGPSSATR